MSLIISWLNQFPTIADLLDRHRAAARVLGGFSETESQFIKTVEEKKQSQHSFRGIPSLFNSTFEVSSPNEFRGMKTYYHRDEAHLNKPPFSAPTEKTVTYSLSDEKANFDNAARVNSQDDVLFKKNEELFDLFVSNPQLRDAFVNGDYLKFEEKLARAAKEKLGWSPNVSEEFLQRNPTEALLITANIGGAADSLKEEGTAGALNESVRLRLRDEIFDELAQKVAEMMDNSTQLDKSFFQEHPKAALFLLEHPEERRRINDELEAQNEFKRHVADYEAQVDPITKAQSLAGSNPTLRADFWEDNPELALMLYAQKAAGSNHSIQLTALDIDVNPHEGTTPADVVTQDQAKRAAQIVGDKQPLNENFLKEKPHLARWINEQVSFGENLKNDPDLAELVDGDNPENNRILRAYVSGFTGRGKSYWQWWA